MSSLWLGVNGALILIRQLHLFTPYGLQPHWGNLISDHVIDIYCNPGPSGFCPKSPRPLSPDSSSFCFSVRFAFLASIPCNANLLPYLSEFTLHSQLIQEYSTLFCWFIKFLNISVQLFNFQLLCVRDDVIRDITGVYLHIFLQNKWDIHAVIPSVL